MPMEYTSVSTTQYMTLFYSLFTCILCAHTSQCHSVACGDHKKTSVPVFIEHTLLEIFLQILVNS